MMSWRANRKKSPPESASLPGRIDPERARRIKLVVLDVDGVLTDAGVYLGTTSAGEMVELKRFDIQDGVGILLLRQAGLQVAIVSGRVSEATALRAKELGIEEVHQDPSAHKVPIVEGIMSRLGLGWDEVAMVGDDLPDLPLLVRVGLPVAVGNATSDIRRVALWTTRRDGGHGAVREFARVLLEARGEWAEQVRTYCAARGGLDID